MNTRISYMYRDANNYKVSTHVILEGELSKSQIKKMLDLTKGGDFIPSQVDLDDLQDGLQCYDSKDWGEDHCWHEIEEDSFSLTNDAPTTQMTAKELYNNWIETKGEWKEFEVGHILNEGEKI